MVRRRLGFVAAVIAALVVASLTPFGSARALQEDAPLADGRWVGNVVVGGEYHKAGGSGTGPYSDTVVPVFSTITIDLIAVPDGQVAGGEMAVEQGWSAYGFSTDEQGSYSHANGHQDKANLSLSGNVTALMATGTLDWDRSIYVDGDYIEEVSGSRPGDVHWEFEIVESMCGMVTGRLTQATGPGLMTYVAVPNDAEDIVYNELYAVYQV